MSRRVRKTNHGITDWNNLVATIKEIKVDHKSLRFTARAYNIPKSSLGRYVNKLNDANEDISTLDDDALLKLVKSVSSYATPSLVS